MSGKAARLARTDSGAWRAALIALPANGVVKIQSTGGGTNHGLLSFESLTTAQSLYHVTPGKKPVAVMSMPEFFDASDVVVEQRFAISKDGTRIPYFIMAQRAVLETGGAPTVQYAYGGFLDATLPVYYEDPSRPQHGALGGKLWLARAACSWSPTSAAAASSARAGTTPA